MRKQNVYFQLLLVPLGVVHLNFCSFHVGHIVPLNTYTKFDVIKVFRKKLLVVFKKKHCFSEPCTARVSTHLTSQKKKHSRKIFLSAKVYYQMYIYHINYLLKLFTEGCQIRDAQNEIFLEFACAKFGLQYLKLKLVRQASI